jgi:hypothetical protein
MEFRISYESVKRTTKCPSNFFCLTNVRNPMCSKERPMCSVEVPLESMIFVKDKNQYNAYNDCAYKVAHGAGHLCTCPVRFEIYSRYKR